MIKVLQIVSTTSISRGDFMVALNYYRNMDHDKIVFDFAYINDCENNVNKELITYGSKIFKFSKPGIKNIQKTISDLRKIINDGNYDIVHLHIPSFQIFVKKAMRKTSCKHLIIHSHSSKLSTEFLYKIRNKIMTLTINKNISARFACSQIAGKALFGASFGKKKNDYVINNAIDLSKFKYNKKIAYEIKKELHIDDNDICVCHVGRFEKEKNHKRLIKIFAELRQKNNKFKLFLIGDGSLKREIQNQVSSQKLNESVVFLGNRNDVPDLLKAMDIMIFPSFFEGLGMALIEAQAAGVLCFASDVCPKDVEITKNITRISLSRKNEDWVEEIIEKYNAGWDRETKKQIEESKYSIKHEAESLYNLYLNIKG